MSLIVENDMFVKIYCAFVKSTCSMMSFLLMVFHAFCSILSAISYYVSTTGNDDNSVGSSATVIASNINLQTDKDGNILGLFAIEPANTISWFAGILTVEKVNDLNNE